mgnify:CR=1 FL=1|tara:strand:+ start:130 stop:732 length:603 start_codon:yes stop_codon:yes gene_type:complete
MIRSFTHFDLNENYNFAETLEKVYNHKELLLTPHIIIQSPTIKNIESLDFKDKDLKYGHFKITGKKLQKFKDYMNKFDEWVLEYLFNNCETLFSKKIESEHLRSIYNNTISENDNIKLFLPRMSNKVKLTIIDNNKEPIEINELHTDTQLVGAIRCRKIVIYKREIIPQWEILLASIKKDNITECMIIDDDDEEEIFGDD